MNAPVQKPAQAKPHAGPEFFTGVSLEVAAVIEAYRQLEPKCRDLAGSLKHRQAVSLKLAADDIARIANQMQIMAAHLAKVTAIHVNRRPRA